MPSPRNFLSSWQERLSAIRNVPVVLRIVWQSGRSVVAFGIVFRLISALLPLAIAWVGPKLIIDTVQRVITTHQPIPSRLWYLVGLEFLLAVIASMVSRLVDYLDSLLADNYMRHVSIQVMKHAAELDLLAYEDPVFYDRLERARVQATDRLGMIQSIGRLIQQVVTTIAFSVSIVFFSPWLLLLLIAGVVPAFLGESHFAFLGYAKNFKQTPVKRQLDYLRILGGSKEAAKELKLFGLKDFLTERFTHLSNQIYDEDVSLATRKLRAGSLLSILGTTGYYGAYVYVIWRTVTGALTLGSLTFLTGAIMQASANIQQIFSTASGIADQALFLTDLVAFLQMQPTIRSKPNALPSSAADPARLRISQCFLSLSRRAAHGAQEFKFPTAARRTNRADRRKRPGQDHHRQADHAPLRSDEGQVLLDGVDLREYDLESLYREIGVIFQDFMRYEMTARENIAVGRIEELDNDDLLQHAAHKSMADEVIERLPAGYEQMLGRRFDGGVDLSGGEWQKIALARAYLRDAQLLILDEPTAALDARSEFEVFQRFAELTAGKMALFISHRFSTVRMADRIVVLEDGRIAEDGKHEELTHLGGRYAEMFEMQAASYR